MGDEVVLPDGKKPWQSKTILINAIIALVGAVALFVPAAGSVGAWINSHGGEIGMGWGVLNMILRLVTKDKITLVD